MFQSNKEYIKFLTQAGVHTFLKETPNNLIKNKEIYKEINENNKRKSLDQITEIKDLIPLIFNHKSNLKKTANKLDAVRYMCEMVRRP